MAKKQVMSIAIDPEIFQDLKKNSKQRGISASSFVQDLIEKSLKIDINDEIMMVGKPVDQAILPVVLKIPVSLKGDGEGLKAWLDAKVSGLVNKLSQS